MTVYTAAQAANVCQVSLRTVQRRIPQLEAAGAWKDTEGKWRIPVEAMSAAGLCPGRPAAPEKSLRQSLRQHDSDYVNSHDNSYDNTDTTSSGATPIATTTATPPPPPPTTPVVAEAEVRRLKAETADWRRRAEVAEAQAAERSRIIETQAIALRALEAAVTQLQLTTAPHQAISTPDRATTSRRRSWFRRRPQSVHDA
ncbi:MAG: hypothetical protein K0U78_02925 [Actinomycetia bacterium]|nr:hypothetical protein [Actinomycetes bacterium]